MPTISGWLLVYLVCCRLLEIVDSLLWTGSVVLLDVHVDETVWWLPVWLQGVVDAGSERPISISWTPPAGHEVNYTRVCCSGPSSAVSPMCLCACVCAHPVTHPSYL